MSGSTTADATDTTGTTGTTAPVEHLDVLVVGAGLSGIGAGYHLQTDCPWASYAILEARASIGGTWDLFRYPGIRSDSDMHTFGYPFRPWTSEQSIGDGAAILQYLKDTAEETGVADKIRFHHKIVKADWSTAEARWHVTAERTDPETDTSELVELTAGFLFACTGYYRYDHGYTPELPGRDDFRGTIIHPQHWPEDLDYRGKKIVVIGSGATAITLLPSLAKTAGHVTMLQRSPSYVTSAPQKSPVAKVLRALLPEAKAEPAIRWTHALGTQGIFQISKKRPELVKKVLKRGVKAQLPRGYDVDTHFTPRYDPWDQRLCVVPDGDLFKAIKAGTASVVTDTIDTFTETGIRLSSGRELEADIIVTATGLEVLFLGGMSLDVDGEPVEVQGKLAYKGMMLEGLPNFALAIGYTNASWTLKADLTQDYVCRLLNHLRATGMRQCMPVNDDPSVTRSPMLGLSSGYISRAADRMPSQGSRFPWQVHQSYWRDYRTLRKSDIDDGTMVFSKPAPKAPVGTAARVLADA